MTKRSAEQALRDELQSKAVLLDRLRDQESRRKAAYVAANASLEATRSAIRETEADIERTKRAIETIAPNGQEAPDAAT